MTRATRRRPNDMTEASAPPTTTDQPLGLAAEPGSPTFVFLDLNSEPWLVHQGWLHRWHRGAKCWVTARELRNFELGEMEKRKLKPEHAALYGPPCSENGMALARAGAETSNEATDTQDENKQGLSC